MSTSRGKCRLFSPPETALKRSYRVILPDGEIRWEGGPGAILDREPDASLRRRVVAKVISLLPVESQL